MNKKDKPVVANRRKRLQEWIDTHYKGVQAAFIEKTGINQGELSALLKSKSFGEKKARKLEEDCGMPNLWLDASILDNNTAPSPDINGKVPLISNVQAGMWAEIIDNFHVGDAEAWIETTARITDSMFALRVVGDSMVNPSGFPSLPPGVIVIVDPQKHPCNGNIVIARLEDSMEATIKKLVIDGNQKFLKPLNPHYPVIPINGNCTIVGVAVKVEFDL